MFQKVQCGLVVPTSTKFRWKLYFQYYSSHPAVLKFFSTHNLASGMVVERGFNKEMEINTHNEVGRLLNQTYNRNCD